jgi:hypothetical protein
MTISGGFGSCQMRGEAATSAGRIEDSALGLALETAIRRRRRHDGAGLQRI